MTTAARVEKLLDLEKFDQALVLLKTQPVPGAEGQYLLGQAYRLAGDCRAAAIHYKKAAALASREADIKCQALNGLAASLRTLGISQQALDVSLLSFKTAEEYGFDELALSARLERAMALRALGRLSAALVELDRISIEYSREGDLEGVGYIHWAKGGLYRLQGRFADSIKAFKASASCAKRVRDDSALGYAYFGLAGVSRVAGDIPSSEKYYRLAGKIFSKSGDLFARAYAFCGLANALRQKGDLNQAYSLYKQADVLYSRIGDRADLGFVKWGMGVVLEARGKLAEALELYQESEKLFKGYSESRGLALAGLRQASVLYLMGRTTEAEQKYDSAVKLARKEGLHTYLEHFT